MYKKILLIIAICLFPLRAFALDDPISNAKSGILMEASTGKIIFKKNINERLSVASMTKMVAQIIILEKQESGKIKWNDVVTVSKNAADMGGSQIYIAEGEKISIEDLMKGISMASGNDATVAMAEYIAGSEEKFVELMNKKVKELGLKNTVFKNSTGLDEEGHFSSAYDMAIIARELVTKHPDIFKFSSMYEDYLREDTDNKFWLVNTNKLIRFYDGADGLKTGHTDNAGYCLAATAKRGGLRLIAIVLGEKDNNVRNSEAMSMLDYGFNNIKMKVLKEKGTVVKNISLDKANTKEFEAILKDDLGVVVSNYDDEVKYNYKIKMDDISLPLKKGSKIGNIYVYNKDKKVSEEELISNKEVLPLSYLELLYKSIKDIVSGNI